MKEIMHRLLTIVFSFWICCAFGQLQFTEKASSVGINHEVAVPFYVGGGCAFFDYNNDGYQDIYMTGGAYTTDKLYRNEGNGLFMDVSTSAGITAATQNMITTGVTTGDIDNDGFREIFITAEQGYSNVMLYNTGAGVFYNIAGTAGLSSLNYGSYTASFGDYNEDGYLDLYVSNYVDSIGFFQDSSGAINGFNHRCFPNHLYLNNGNLTFTEEASLRSVIDTGCTLSNSFTDYDSDGDVDILSINDFGEDIVPNLLFRNDDSTFTDVSSISGIDTPGIYGMGLAVGDFDQDMDLDYYVTNIGRNTFYVNQGDGTFIDKSDSLSIDNTFSIGPNNYFTTGWGTGFFDADNDTDLDLFIANGEIPVAPFIQNEIDDPDKFYMNMGNGTFLDIGNVLGVDDNNRSRGFAYGDYDNDGDLDMLVTRIWDGPQSFPGNVLFYENTQMWSNNWLELKLEGVVTNRDAFGTQVEIHVGGKSWLHEVSGGSSHLSQHSSVLHFGLAQDSIVDSLVIHWLNGIDQTLYDVTANQILYVLEDTSSPVIVGDTSTTVVYFDSVRSETFDVDTSIFVISANSSFSPDLTTWIKVYPNPVQDLMQVDFMLQDFRDGMLFLELYNGLGQRLESRTFSHYQGAIEHQVFDLRTLPAGRYCLRLRSQNKALHKSFIKH